VSEERTSPKPSQEELEAERATRAMVHRLMGMGAALLTVVAVIIAYWRLAATLGGSGLEMSFGQAVGIGLSALPWVILVILVGVLFSLGTTRVMLGLEWVWKKIRGKRHG